MKSFRRVQWLACLSLFLTSVPDSWFAARPQGQNCLSSPGNRTWRAEPGRFLHARPEKAFSNDEVIVVKHA